MRIIESIKQLFRNKPEAGGIVTGERYDVPHPAGFILSSDTPLAVAAVYRCVNFIADSVANLPIRPLRRKGDVYIDDIDDSLFNLLTVEPAPHINAVDFWQMIVRQILLQGNSYVVPVFDEVSKKYSRLILVNPNCVSYDKTFGVYKISDLEHGVSGDFDEDEILHFKNYSIDGFIGISTIAYAASVIDTASIGDRETQNRFSNGGIIRGIVSNGKDVGGFGAVQDRELQRKADDLDSRFRKGERIVSVPGVAQFSPLSQSSADMQFLEQRKMTVKDVCRFFGVHPSFVFEDSSNYKTVDMANVAFLSNTLNPLLRKIELEARRKLISPSFWGKKKIEFDRSGLYAADLEGKAKYQTAQLACGALTVNELRQLENRPTVEGGDVPLVSANLITINAIKNKNTAYGQE